MEKRELKVFIGMNRTLNAISRAANQVFSKYELTAGQFGVLEALYHKGSLTVGQVQEKILSTSGTIPVIVRNLEKEGLLKKRRDEWDKRKYILEITSRGRELMDKAYPENEALLLEMIGVWSQAEQEQLVKLFKKFGGIEDEEESR